MKQLGLNFNVEEPQMRVKPHIHQLIEYNEHTFDKARALFWYMRTGKSKAIIDQACKLYLEKEIRALIVIAPNGVHENWIDKEIPKHIWLKIPYLKWCWSTKLKENPVHIDILQTTCRSNKFSIFAFPSSTLVHPLAKKYITMAIASKKGEVMLCIDESHDFRTPGSKRTKWARAIAKRCKYKRILSGTPDFNSLLHYYPQLELLKPGALGYTRFEAFKNRYANYEMTNMGYPRLLGYKNIPELKTKVMKYATVIQREDCPYLSSINKQQIIINLTDTQLRASAILNANTIKALEELPKDNLFSIVSEIERSYIKHQQIASGFVIGIDPDTGNRKIHSLIQNYRNPKLQQLIKEITYTIDQVIVWAHFRYDIELIHKVLTEMDIPCASYYGNISNSNKRKIRTDFENKRIKVFIGQPQSAGLGLDLSSSSKIIWYSHTRDTIIRSQANERATSMKNAFIELIDFQANPIDKTILKILNMNIDISTYIANTDVNDLMEDIKIRGYSEAINV